MASAHKHSHMHSVNIILNEWIQQQQNIWFQLLCTDYQRYTRNLNSGNHWHKIFSLFNSRYTPYSRCVNTIIIPIIWKEEWGICSLINFECAKFHWKSRMLRVSVSVFWLRAFTVYFFLLMPHHSFNVAIFVCCHSSLPIVGHFWCAVRVFMEFHIFDWFLKIFHIECWKS